MASLGHTQAERAVSVGPSPDPKAALSYSTTKARGGGVLITPGDKPGEGHHHLHFTDQSLPGTA